MSFAIKLKSPGGPEQLEQVAWPPQLPGAGEIRLRHEAIGVNFIDIYHRRGLYPLPAPNIPGVEGVGRIEALGEGVEGLAIGQRVAYAGVIGGYADTRLLPAWRAMPLPDAIESTVVAASLLRGLTAHMLLTRTYPVAKGTTVLVHAAAGGLGAIATRWAKQLGATVIGTVGSGDKVAAARSSGADHVIVGRDADYAAEVNKLTGGRGVDFAIDGIGGTTLARTLGCVRRFGSVASIGEAAGPIPPIPVDAIGPVRALNFARPSVMAYAAEPETYADAVRAVLSVMLGGIVAPVAGRYPLAQAARAQADVEAGRFAGAIVLLP